MSTIFMFLTGLAGMVGGFITGKKKPVDQYLRKCDEVSNLVNLEALKDHAGSLPDACESPEYIQEAFRENRHDEESLYRERGE